MPAGRATKRSPPEAASQRVRVHIYEVGRHCCTEYLNKVFVACGTGAFHAGVEVLGSEWSYGYTEDGTGVFRCEPKLCNPHRYRMSIDMDVCVEPEERVHKVIDTVKGYWQGAGYDLMRINCCHFADTLCRTLAVGVLPQWVTNLAAAGATLQDRTGGGQPVTPKAVIAAAMAGDIDAKYLAGRGAAAKPHLFLKGRIPDERCSIARCSIASPLATCPVGEAAPPGQRGGASERAKSLAVFEEAGWRRRLAREGSRRARSIAAEIDERKAKQRPRITRASRFFGLFVSRPRPARDSE